MALLDPPVVCFINIWLLSCIMKAIDGSLMLLAAIWPIDIAYNQSNCFLAK